MDNSMINRSAADKTKGFRLQKLRAIELMLDSISRIEKPMIYSAIEHVEDVYVKDRADENKELFEEDKNYDPNSTFTLNSHQVVNTLVSFIDIWFKFSTSENLAFGFYSTNKITKESTSSVIKDNNIELPDKPILELLVDKTLDYKNLIDCVKKFLVAEYKRQYSKPTEPGMIASIEAMALADWKSFLSCIDWKFGEPDEQEKKKELIKKIQSCKYYNNNHCGKEESIFAQLMEMFDERQNLPDVTERFVHAAEIQLVFVLSAASANSLSSDPVWELWKTMETSDSRNLVDKIQSVCPKYNNDKIKVHAQIVSRNLLEQQRLASDKSILSLRYRIFEHCKEYLVNYLANKGNPQYLKEEEIDEIFVILKSEASNMVQELSGEFKYSFINNKMIDGIILELFDSCFLAFDKNGEQ